MCYATWELFLESQQIGSMGVSEGGSLSWLYRYYRFRRGPQLWNISGPHSLTLCVCVCVCLQYTSVCVCAYNILPCVCWLSCVKQMSVWNIKLDRCSCALCTMTPYTHKHYLIFHTPTHTHESHTQTHTHTHSCFTALTVLVLSILSVLFQGVLM